MKAIRQFQEFLDQGSVKKQSPDRSRAEFLTNEAGRSYDFLLKLINNMSVDKNNANTYVKNCYDILMELVRAKMLLSGFNASGPHGHEAEVAYLRNIGFKETDVQFADQMRYFRNGMLYYGTSIDEEYAKKVIEFTKRMYPKLK
jgi:hypothetical protein